MDHAITDKKDTIMYISRQADGIDHIYVVYKHGQEWNGEGMEGGREGFHVYRD